MISQGAFFCWKQVRQKGKQAMDVLCRKRIFIIITYACKKFDKYGH